MISLGIILAYTPPPLLYGNELIHKTVKLTIYIILLLCSDFYGIEIVSELMNYLRILMVCSISGTCYFAEVMFIDVVPSVCICHPTLDKTWGPQGD